MLQALQAGAWRGRLPRPVRAVGWRTFNLIRRTRPGLLMRYAASVPPAEIEPPTGYEVRAWRYSDREPWLELMNSSGSFGEWDSARLEQENRGMLPEAQMFVQHAGRLVAATGALDRPLRNKPALEMAWVTRDPSQSGKGLGRLVFVRALRAVLEQHPGTPVYLYTDDERLTAIQLYLELGFVPDLRSHRSYPRRWERAFVALARRAPRAT